MPHSHRSRRAKHSRRSKKASKKSKTRSSSRRKSIETRQESCYVVYGKGFKPLKIKGYSNRNKLIESLKLKGFKPTSSVLNCNSYSGKKSKTVPSYY